MTNDKDIDVLMRHYAKRVVDSTASVEHLDADELNAYAEGALPPAARQRYVSHLADCDQCRKLAARLTIAAGSALAAQVPASQPITETWWQKLSAAFALPALRYAAFAILLVAVVGVSLLVWRRPTRRNAELIAQNQPQAAPLEAVKPSNEQEATKEREALRETATTKAVPQPTVATTLEQKQPETSAAAAPPPPKTESGLTDKPALASRTVEQPRAEASPSYAPAPPTETTRADSRARENQNVGQLKPSGPRRSESSEKYRTVDQMQSGDFAKARDEDRSRVATQATTEKELKDDQLRARSGTLGSSRRSVQEMRVEERKSGGDKRANTEEAPETRSVGGRKFKRQGNAWIDSKFKSSLSVRNVARGSEEFEKLDSGLRSIAQQLSGEIVVVWKGKAYRIK